MVRRTEWLVRLGSWMGDARQSSARTAGDVVLVWCPSGAVGDEVRRRPAERSRDRGNPTGRSRSVVSASDGVPWTSQPVLGGWLRHGPRDAVRCWPTFTSTRRNSRGAPCSRNGTRARAPDSASADVGDRGVGYWAVSPHTGESQQIAHGRTNPDWGTERGR
jgi:hypothetical protein